MRFFALVLEQSGIPEHAPSLKRLSCLLFTCNTCVAWLAGWPERKGSSDSYRLRRAGVSGCRWASVTLSVAILSSYLYMPFIAGWFLRLCSLRRCWAVGYYRAATGVSSLACLRIISLRLLPSSALLLPSAFCLGFQRETEDVMVWYCNTFCWALWRRYEQRMNRRGGRNAGRWCLSMDDA